ncbi:MAG: DUF3109 family protein [Ignavibacteria bacterium]|nr:DUF3109 family protein [Ignavibacteria bacterium]
MEKEVYFIKVNEVTINNELFDEYFECDLNACKGACCTIEDAYGAPITNQEANFLQKEIETIAKYLPEKNKMILSKLGPYEVIKGNLHTRTVEEKDCVFVFKEDGIAKCAIERAYQNNEIDFRKPLSCHLFPIKRNVFGNDVLRVEKLSICKSAFSNGLDSKTRVYEFCKDALIRLYGKDWFNKLKSLANQFIKDD